MGTTFNILDALAAADFRTSNAIGSAGAAKIYTFNFENIQTLDAYCRKSGFSINGSSDTSKRKKLRALLEHCIQNKLHKLFLTKFYFVLYSNQTYSASDVCRESNATFRSAQKFLDECKILVESEEFKKAKIQITRFADVVKTN